jgi:hypothetical protein
LLLVVSLLLLLLLLLLLVLLLLLLWMLDSLRSLCCSVVFTQSGFVLFNIVGSSPAWFVLKKELDVLQVLASVDARAVDRDRSYIQASLLYIQYYA